MFAKFVTLLMKKKIWQKDVKNGAINTKAAV